MPTFVITTPDGKRVKVTAPEGATKEQALAKVKASYKAQPAAQSAPEWNPTQGGSQPLRVGIPGTDIGTDVMVPEGVANFAAGAGKSVVDIGRGLRQIGAGIADRFAGGDRSAALAQQADESAAMDSPLMSSKAGVAGNIAGTIGTIYATGGALQAVGRGSQVATVGRALSAPTTYTGAAAVGGGLGALQPVGTGGSRAANAGVGALLGAAGQGVANAAGRIAQPIKRALTPAQSRAVTTLEQAGVPLDAAQKSGAPGLQRVKSALRDNPVTLPAQQAQYEAQATAFNRAALRSIGVNADRADEAVMGAAKKRIGSAFDQAVDGVQVKFSSGFRNQLGVLGARSKRLLPGDSNQITATISDVLEHAKANGGAIEGKFYKAIRSDLSALEKARDVGPVARELREALDNAFEQAAGPGRAKLITQARRDYRNLKILEDAIDTEGLGNISPAKLANAFGKKANRNVGIYGQGDKSVLELAKLAKAGKQLLPDKLPQSGTVPRALAQAALPAAAGAAYGGFKEGDMSGAVAYGIGGAALPYLLQRGLNAPGASNYMSSGLGAGQTRNALLMFQNSALPRLLPIAATPAVVAK